MQRKPEFLLDADGVVLDFLTPALKVVEQVTKRRYTPMSFLSWDIFDLIGEQYRKPCQKLFDEQGFCASVLPYPGAVDGVSRLKDIVNLHVLTSPMHTRFWYHERVEVMRTHFGLPPRSVTFTAHKQNYFGHYLLDDRPKHVEEWARHHELGIAMLWDQPYNRGADTAFLGNVGNACRVRSWEEVLCIVKHGELHASLYQAPPMALRSPALQQELRVLPRWTASHGNRSSDGG